MTSERGLKGMVVAPRTPQEAYGALEKAVRNSCICTRVHMSHTNGMDANNLTP